MSLLVLGCCPLTNHSPFIPTILLAGHSCKGTIDDIKMKLNKIQVDRQGATATLQRAIEQVRRGNTQRVRVITQGLTEIANEIRFSTSYDPAPHSLSNNLRSSLPPIRPLVRSSRGPREPTGSDP